MAPSSASEAEEVGPEEHHRSTFVPLPPLNRRQAESTASWIAAVAVQAAPKKFCGDRIAVAAAAETAAFDVAVVAAVGEAVEVLTVVVAAAVVAAVALELVEVVVVVVAAGFVVVVVAAAVAVGYPEDSSEILRSDYRLPDFAETFCAPGLSPRPPWS